MIHMRSTKKKRPKMGMKLSWKTKKNFKENLGGLKNKIYL